MTLSGAKARFQLNATATPTGVNVTGPNVIGQGLGSTSFTDADIVYSFTVENTGTGDVATLNAATGAITKTSGTPDVTRWGSQTNDLSAVDFEGVALPTLSSIYGIMATTSSGNSFPVTLGGTGSTGSYPAVVLQPDESMLLVRNATAPPATMTFGFSISSSGGDTVTITIIGKSS